MNRTARTLALACILLTSIAAAAATPDDPLKVAQRFYDSYMKLLAKTGETQSWVLASPDLTAGFKKAYKRFMKDAGSDPIICGQDYPDKGFAASHPAINGDKATVKMNSRDPAFANVITVSLVRQGGRWLISGTSDLKEE